MCATLLSVCYLSTSTSVAAHGPIPDRLQQAMLPVVEHSVCSRSDWWGGNVKTTMVCAGGDVVSGCNVSKSGAYSSSVLS